MYYIGIKSVYPLLFQKMMQLNIICIYIYIYIYIIPNTSVQNTQHKGMNLRKYLAYIYFPIICEYN